MKKYNFLYNVPEIIDDNDYLHNDNIVNASASLFKKLIKNHEVVCCAEMQSGKTDVMKRLIYVINNYNKNIKSLGININRFNIYLVLCASSVNLKKQLIEKLPEIKTKIYHLNNIKTLIKNQDENDHIFNSITNSGLVIFDECHSDAEEKNLIDQFRKILDSVSKENDSTFYKIGFSATPYEQILAGFPKVIMKPADGYYGLRQMFDKNSKNVVFQARNLADRDSCAELFNEINLRNKYYIFRLPGNKTDDMLVFYNIKYEFKKRNVGFDSYIYDMSYFTNINNILIEKPSSPTVIFLRNKLRMGEYLDTRYIYLVHDDPKNMFVHTTVQSLIGRCCGYNKLDNHTYIYCDYNKAYQHYKWIKHDYDIIYIPSNIKYFSQRFNRVKDICIYKM